MSAKHTHGPWVVCYTTLGRTVLSWHIAGNQHGSSLPICVSDKFSDSRDQNQEVANSRLIAAAPDLLTSAREALSAMESIWRTKGMDDEWIYDEMGSELSSGYFALRDAIAKATGEA